MHMMVVLVRTPTRLRMKDACKFPGVTRCYWWNARVHAPNLFAIFCVLHCLEASPYRRKAEWQALPLSAGVSSDVFLLGCIGRCFGAWQEEPRTIITNARMAVACSDKPVCAIPIIVSYYHHTTFPVYLCSKHWSNISYDTLSVLWC